MGKTVLTTYKFVAKESVPKGLLFSSGLAIEQLYSPASIYSLQFKESTGLKAYTYLWLSSLACLQEAAYLG